MTEYICAEKSLHTTFGRTILKPFHKAVREFGLIERGDRIAVCISGGKDSALLAKLVQDLQKYGGIGFEAEFISVNPGYSPENLSRLSENSEKLGIPLKIFSSEIFSHINSEEKNPCFLCASLRRTQLYTRAKSLGCNKIALGHHFDDVIETTLMGMLFGGQMQTMLPRRKSDGFKGMEIVRPLYYVRESEIARWASENGLGFLNCACRVTEQGGNQERSKRAEIKRLISRLAKTNPQLEMNIFRSAQNVNVKNIFSYKDERGLHSFLDDFRR